jgi:hypothetical protein
MAQLTSAELSVTKADVDKFLQATEAQKANMDEARAEIGAAHKTLIDEKGCNKKGLAIFKSLAQMKPNKRADALRTLDALRGFYDNEWKNPDLVDQAEGA